MAALPTAPDSTHICVCTLRQTVNEDWAGKWESDNSNENSIERLAYCVPSSIRCSADKDSLIEATGSATMTRLQSLEKECFRSSKAQILQKPSVEQDTSQKATELSDEKREMAELLREMKRIKKQLQLVRFSKSNRPFSWSVRRLGIMSERWKGHLRKAIASCRTAVSIPVASIPITQTQVSAIVDKGTEMISELKTGTSNRLNYQTTPASDGAEKFCGSGCGKRMKFPPSSLFEQDELRPPIIETFCCGKDDDGFDQTIELALIRNDRSPKPRLMYPVVGTLYAITGEGICDPSIMIDTGAACSLMTRSVAEATKWPGYNPDDVKHHKKFILLNGNILQSIGTWHALLYLRTSMRLVWVEFAVVEDNDLPPEWQILLSENVCYYAGLLASGPSISGPCACVQDWHSPYVSKSIVLGSKPKSMSMHTTTPDLAVGSADTQNGA